MRKICRSFSNLRGNLRKIDSSLIDNLKLLKNNCRIDSSTPVFPSHFHYPGRGWSLTGPCWGCPPPFTLFLGMYLRKIITIISNFRCEFFLAHQDLWQKRKVSIGKYTQMHYKIRKTRIPFLYSVFSILNILFFFLFYMSWFVQILATEIACWLFLLIIDYFWLYILIIFIKIM